MEAYANVFNPIKSRVLSIYSTNYNYIHHMTLPSRSFFLIEVALLSSNSLSNSLGCLLSHGQGLSYSSARHNSGKEKNQINFCTTITLQPNLSDIQAMPATGNFRTEMKGCLHIVFIRSIMTCRFLGR